jgi:hypothetical protein
MSTGGGKHSGGGNLGGRGGNRGAEGRCRAGLHNDRRRRAGVNLGANGSTAVSCNVVPDGAKGGRMGGNGGAGVNERGTSASIGVCVATGLNTLRCCATV